MTTQQTHGHDFGGLLFGGRPVRVRTWNEFVTQTENILAPYPNTLATVINSVRGWTANRPVPTAVSLLKPDAIPDVCGIFAVHFVGPVNSSTFLWRFVADDRPPTLDELAAEAGIVVDGDSLPAGVVMNPSALIEQ